MTLPSRATLYDTFLLDAEGAERTLDFVRRLATGPRWLEAGCGTGRLLPGLMAAGFEVVGVDRDEDYLARARMRAPAARVELGDISSLEGLGLGVFDGILACNGPLSYLLDDDALERALRGFTALLKPGGVLITDTPNLPWILENYRRPEPQRAVIDGLAVERLGRHEHDAASRRFDHVEDFVARRDGLEVGRRSQRYRFAIRSAAELVAAHRRAGFQELERWASWSATEPSEDGVGPRVVLSAGVTPGGSCAAGG
jgi:SAM-dependent methyltransferase